MANRLNNPPSSLQLGKRVVSKEEKDLWHKVISDVDPLVISDKNIETDISQANKEDWIRADRSIEETSVNSINKNLSHGNAPDLDRATKQRMRRGKVSIEARIDLHGLTQSEAHQTLNDFLYNCRAQGLRTVLVITGKGVGGQGVLRAVVPKWLNQDNIRKLIRAFSYAVPKDGGEGAIYVMLKRLR
jgi:DNA-nicking Smr family endonuclease